MLFNIRRLSLWANKIVKENIMEFEKQFFISKLIALKTI
jgi:hypothetical protein